MEFSHRDPMTLIEASPAEDGLGFFFASSLAFAATRFRCALPLTTLSIFPQGRL